MSGRQFQSFFNNSLAIRQEIHRFESVHPNIYAIYDLIELIPDPIISQQVREHVVSIEDSFVNSQEWTLSRSVPDLRLGIVGSLSSGKSALVHRYLTGSYMQEESPEGGRFKKEVQLDGQSYLLLIRDEGGPPELQFTSWVDAVIFVFSLESEASFNAIYSFYTRMAQHRNASEVPLLLVGTQDAISETSPRVIDDTRARKLASDLKCCGYYETCATYGLAVQQVFLDACLRIVQARGPFGPMSVGTPTASRPTTPIHGPVNRYHSASASNSNSASSNHVQCSPSPNHKDNLSRQVHTLSASSHQLYRHPELLNKADALVTPGSYATLGPGLAMAVTPVDLRDSERLSTSDGLTPPPRDKDLPTPTSTPTTSRKSRRRSNLFTSSKKNDDKSKNGELGSGRAIPLKQGFLYKRSSKSLKEWKKKYVALNDDGIFTYFPNLQDYMDDVHGKLIPLQYVTVKVPGQKPRGSRATLPPTNGIAESFTNLSISSQQGKDRRVLDGPGEEGYSCFTNGSHLRPEAISNVKKRHRRIKSSGIKAGDNEESDGYEFLIVSLDNKSWHFEASSIEERDDWVTAIEQQILQSLQGSGVQAAVDIVGVQAVLNVSGNSQCVDCSAPSPEWASLNLGVVMCIECSGIHRNLGTHISKVRSLHLDEWSPSNLSVMLNLGNSMANSVWEHGAPRGCRPTPTSSRDEKERWIRRKYEAKEFLGPPPKGSLGPALVDAVCRSDVQSIYAILVHASAEDVNCTVGPRDSRTPLHLACTLGSLPIAQLLIWYGANVKALDQDGRSCLACARSATSAQASELVELLLSAARPDS